MSAWRQGIQIIYIHDIKDMYEGAVTSVKMSRGMQKLLVYTKDYPKPFCL